MERPTLSVERVGRTVAYLVLGTVGTVALALALLRYTVPMQRVFYDLFYLRLGPSDATEVATLVHVLAVGIFAITVPVVLADYLSAGLRNREALLAAVVVLSGAIVALLALALLGVVGTPVAFLLLTGGLLAVPFVLRYRFHVRSGALPAFVGGIPVLVLLLLLAAFGLGWGWGYVVTAQEVPDGSVGDVEPGTLAEAPAVEAALFSSGNCETEADGLENCYLSLRGFEHERAATRALADLGVRCPYQGSGADGGTAIVSHGDRYYEVSCSPHGD